MPRDDLAGKQIHYTGQINEVVYYPDIRNVTAPNSIWFDRIKLFIQNILQCIAKIEIFGSYCVWIYPLYTNNRVSSYMY